MHRAKTNGKAGDPSASHPVAHDAERRRPGRSTDLLRCEKSGDISHADMADLSRRFDTQYRSEISTLAGKERPSFRGHISAQSFSAGLSMGISDLVALTTTRQSAIVPRSLSVALLLEGPEIHASLSGGKAMQLKQASALAVSLGDAVRMTSEVAAGTAAKTVVVQCNPDTLLDEELSTQVDRLTRSTWVESMPLPQRATQLAAEMMAPEADGLSRRLMAESFALEMVASVLGHLSGPVAETSLAARDRARLIRVRELLEAEPHHDHSLGALARESGISVASLKRKFPMLFGKSVIAFLRDIRLDQAYDGICRQGWSIAEAAHYAGYAHTSNFTTAFRRRHGITPGAVSVREPFS